MSAREALTDAEIGRFWEKVSPPDAAGCMLWTASGNGRYGTFAVSRRTTLAHRISARLAWGPPPTPDHVAAHACRNTRCVAPDHLSWETRSENQADRLRDGTDQHGSRGPGARLTEAEVRGIRDEYAKGYGTQEVIASRYGIQKMQVSRIVRRQCWRALP